MRALVAPIVAAVLLGAPPTARADATETAALLHLERGVAAFRAGDYLRARRELEVAHELAPDRANPYRWLALTAVQLGDCKAVLINIDGFLARVAADEPRVAELVRLRELCQRTGVLRVDSSPTAASLHLDGALVGTTPYRTLSLQAGPHTLVADHRGRRSVSRSIVVTAGAELAIRLDLPPARRPLIGRWWFWPTVVGAAALTTAAIVLVADPDDATVLPPIRCDATGCRPGGS